MDKGMEKAVGSDVNIDTDTETKNKILVIGEKFYLLSVLSVSLILEVFMSGLVRYRLLPVSD